MRHSDFKYQIAVLGCASSCLIGAAYANVNMEEEVAFIDPPHVGNAACGALERSFLYLVENTGDARIEIEDFSIVINAEEDSYADNDFLVTVEGGDFFLDYFCEEDLHLDPGDGCFLEVTVDPTKIDCPTHAPTEDGHVVRDLVVRVDAGAQTVAIQPLHFDITALGTAEEYAILADVILPDTKSGPSVLLGDVQVSQDVGCLDDYCGEFDDLDDIWFHNGAELIIGFDTNYFSEIVDTKNVAAVEDTIAAYNTFLAAASDDDSLLMAAFECDAGNTITHLGTTDTELTGGVYCLQPDDTDIYTVDGNITFMGDEDTLFVIVMESQVDDPSFANPQSLNIQSSADYDFENQNTAVDPNNIYWVGADIIVLCPAAEFVGNILTKGDFFAPAFTTTPSSGVPCPSFDLITVPGTITGRVLGVENDVNLTQFYFNGNTISEPKPD